MQTGGSKTLLYAGTTEYPEIPQCDNSRVRSISREVDLSWLAGIVDGEGNIRLGVQLKKCGKETRPYFDPKLRITNTDVRMIKKISEIYVNEEFKFFYSINAVSRYKNKKPTWKDQLEITIGGQAPVARALRLITPYLVNKKRYAKITMDLIDWVQSQPRRGNGSVGTRYTELPQFEAFINAAEEERASLIAPSTTTRRAGETLSW